MGNRAMGLGFLVAGFLSFVTVAWSQESLLLVINEFGQGRAGNGEWVELLVVATGSCSTVDLRGWVLRDRQGNTTGGVYVTFSSHSAWAAVPAGTIIVIYNHNDSANLPTHFPSVDYDFSDFRVVLPANAPGYFTTFRWEGISNAADLLQILTSTGVLVDGVSHGGLPLGEQQVPHLGAVAAGRAAWYVGGTRDGVNDAGNWTIGSDTLPGGSTPGAPNAAANAAWIESLRPKPAISVAPTSHDFGTVYVNTDSAPLTLTVRNTGCMDLVVGTCALTGANVDQFRIQNDGVSGQTLIPNASATLQVVFRPTSSGSKSAILRIPSNDPNNPTVSVNLAGTGQAPASISVMPQTHDFGEVVLNTDSVPVTITVRNLGEANLVIGQVTMGGAHPDQFRIENDQVSNSTIPQNGSATLQVVFGPTSVGAKSAVLTIPSNDPEYPTVTVTLSGTGRAPALVANAGGPYAGVVNVPVTLTGTAAGGLAPYSFAWDLDNDGAYDDAFGETVQWTWNLPGTSTVGLKVTDSQGWEATDTAQVQIYAGAGDVNGDGKVNLVDVRLAYQAVLGLIQLTPEQHGRADMDGDGDVDMQDVQAICCLALGGCN